MDMDATTLALPEDLPADLRARGWTLSRTDFRAEVTDWSTDELPTLIRILS